MRSSRGKAPHRMTDFLNIVIFSGQVTRKLRQRELEEEKKGFNEIYFTGSKSESARRY
jgi:hypothetical protein